MKVVCPNCNSDQISANKKGFSGGKALAGAFMAGGVGLLAGTAGSGKVVCTCLACGHRFPAGKGRVIYEPGEAPVVAAAQPSHHRGTNKVILIVFLSIFALLFLLVLLLG